MFCLSALFVFSACSELDVILMNFCSICIIIIFIVDARYSVFLFSLIIFQLNNLREQIHVIKTWLQFLIKKHVSREFLSFKSFICKEKCRTFAKWEWKRNAISKYFFWENLRSRSFILNFGISIIVEIKDIKCEVLSKHLFQRTLQHGGFTKTLGNDKLV